MASAQAQFAIDIASQVHDAADTNAQIDAIAAQLMGAGKDAAFFGEALDQVNSKLVTAAAASATASAALDEGDARYRSLEKAALTAAKAAEKAALAHGGVVPKELFEAAEQAKRALDAEASSLRVLEGNAKLAADEQDRLKRTASTLGKVQSTVNKKLGDTNTRLSKLRGALGSVGGPLGMLGASLLGPVQGFTEVTEAFGRTSAAMVVGVVGIVAVTAAFTALGVAAVAVGVKLADQARTAALANEAFVALHPELRGTVEQFDAVTRSTGVATARLKDLTKKLQEANVPAEQMPDALKAIATAEAALGAGGADAFIADLKDAKTTVGELANDVQNKFGGIVSRQMLGLEAQGARLRGNVGRLFGGLDIEPMLGGFSTLVNLFDENESAGKALKFVFETLVQPLVDGITRLIPLAEAFFLGFMIGGMKLYIALKPAIKAVKDFLGFDDETSAETFAAFTDAGKVAAYTAAALGVAVATMGAVMVGKGVVSLAKMGASLVAYAARTTAAAVTTTVSTVKMAAAWTANAARMVATTVAQGAAMAVGYLPVLATMVMSTVTGAATMAASFIAMAAPILIPIAAVAALGAALWAVVKYWPEISAAFTAGATYVKDIVVNAFNAVTGFLTSIDLATIGMNIIQGLARGITGAAGFVVDAVKNAVSGAISAAKSLLGIASPSKVFAEFGGFTSEGFADGVEDEAPSAQRALADMVAPPAIEIPNASAATGAMAQVSSPADRGSSVSSGAMQAAGGAAAGASGGVSLSNVSFTFNGVAGAEDALDQFREQLVRILEGDVMQAGGAA